MVRDPKFAVLGKVDLSKVSVIDQTKLGIDFFNEIDIWAQMEFRSRDQSRGRKGTQEILGNRPYSVRHKLG